jgi:hypothetical protein
MDELSTIGSASSPPDWRLSRTVFRKGPSIELRRTAPAGAVVVLGPKFDVFVCGPAFLPDRRPFLAHEPLGHHDVVADDVVAGKVAFGGSMPPDTWPVFSPNVYVTVVPSVGVTSALWITRWWPSTQNELPLLGTSVTYPS